MTISLLFFQLPLILLEVGCPVSIRRMSTTSRTLGSLPAEVQSLIIESLYSDHDKKSLCALRSVCKLYQIHPVLNELFYKIQVLRNDDIESIKTIQEISSSPTYKLLVKELHFKATAPGDQETEYVAGEWDHAKYFPHESPVSHILQNLQTHFPNLQNISVEFVYELSKEINHRQWGTDFYMWDDLEHLAPADRADHEEREPWLYCMQKTYESLAMNEDYRGGLEIICLPPVQISTFSSSVWHTFLSRLTSIKFSMLGQDNGAGWHSNTQESYTNFCNRLSDFVFKSLSSCTSLDFASHEYMPLGCSGYNHMALPLRAEHLPLLQHLRLEQCFIGPELLTFLRAHSSTLTSLHLQNCMSAHGCSMAEDAIPWSEFFSSLLLLPTTSSSPPFPKLTSLTILPIEATKIWDEYQEEDADGNPELAILRDRFGGLEVEHRKGVRMWEYKRTGDRFGMIFELGQVVRERYLEGEDTREFERVMTLVRRNQKTMGVRRQLF